VTVESWGLLPSGSLQIPPHPPRVVWQWNWIVPDAVPMCGLRPVLTVVVVPVRACVQYVSMLRGMTKGRAQYTMQLNRYDVVPPNIQEKIVSQNKVAA
jgi:Elongation factor G C-terminus